MHRISWILGIAAAFVLACGVESAPVDLQQGPEASSPSSVSATPGDDPAPAVAPRNLDDSRCSLIPKPAADCVCVGPNRWVCPEPTGGIFCPVLPPDCCVVRSAGGCRVCAQTGC